MSDNPKHILRTFFQAGERLTGIICCPAISGRLQFAPEGTPDSRVIGRMNCKVIGHAYPVAESAIHGA